MSPGPELPGRVARPQGWKPENLQAAEARSRTQVGRGPVRGRRSPTPRHRDRGIAGWGRGRAEPNSQGPGRAGPGRGIPPGRGRARAERDTLAATCCWIFPSSVTTQCVVAKAPRAATLSKAERLRNQPGLEHGGSSHRPRTPTAAAILPPPSPGAHTGSGNGPPPFAILGRSTLEEEEEPRGRCPLTTGFLGLGFGLGGGEARPLTLAQFGFRSETAFSLLFSCARYDLGAWEPEGEKSSVPVGA